MLCTGKKKREKRPKELHRIIDEISKRNYLLNEELADSKKQIFDIEKESRNNKVKLESLQEYVDQQKIIHSKEIKAEKDINRQIVLKNNSVVFQNEDLRAEIAKIQRQMQDLLDKDRNNTSEKIHLQKEVERSTLESNKFKEKNQEYQKQVIKLQKLVQNGENHVETKFKNVMVEKDKAIVKIKSEKAELQRTVLGNFVKLKDMQQELDNCKKMLSEQAFNNIGNFLVLIVKVKI